MSISESIKTGDFKGEKHVPVIEAPQTVKSGENFIVNVSVGKEIAHPNTTEHFIASITLYYKAKDGKFITQLGSADFTAHGESVEGPNKGLAHTEPEAVFKVKLEKCGTLTAVSYCNIHGLWESSVDITVEA